MKFSFVMPVYNTEKYLADCLSSILFQTFTDFEILLFDDGSTDNSAKVCKAFADQDPRIKFGQIDNGGPARIRNMGIEKATGDYIWFFDSDDKMSDNDCLLQLNKVLSENEVDMLFFLSNNYNGDFTELLKEQKKYPYDGYLPVSGETLLTDLREFDKILQLATSPVNKIFRAKLLKDNNYLFVEHFRWHAEDEFLNKVISNASCFYFFNKELYKVRIRPKSITTTINTDILEKKIYTKVELVDICLHTFSSDNFSDKFKQVMYTYYSYYFLFGFRDYYRLTSPTQKKRIKKYIKAHALVFEKMQNTLSQNLQIAARIYKFLGLNAFLSAIKIRYKL